MYGRVVTYTFSEDKDELEAKAAANVRPLVAGTPGYIAYGVIVTDDRIVSMSAWESEEHAKAADEALREWVQSNTTMREESRTTGDFSWLDFA